MTFFKLQHPLNNPCGIFLIPFGSLISFNDTQLANASLPMDSKDSGSEIVLRSIEQLKALSPIDLTPSGITMFLTNELAKAFGPMFTMSSSILPSREKNNVLLESTSDKLSSLRK